MKDIIYRQDAIDEANRDGAYGYISAEELAKLPSAEPIDVKIAYYKGMQDGIKKCTERLKRLNDEADDS